MKYLKLELGQTIPIIFSAVKKFVSDDEVNLSNVTVLKVSAQMTITNLIFSDELKNENSEEHLILKARLTAGVALLFTSIKGRKTIPNQYRL